MTTGGSNVASEASYWCKRRETSEIQAKAQRGTRTRMRSIYTTLVYVHSAHEFRRVRWTGRLTGLHFAQFRVPLQQTSNFHFKLISNALQLRAKGEGPANYDRDCPPSLRFVGLCRGQC